MNKIYIVIAFIVVFAVGLFVGTRQAVAPAATSTTSGTTTTIPMSIISVNEHDQMFNISVEYPQFSDNMKSLNDAIAQFAQNRIAEFKANSQDAWKARQDTAPQGQPAQQYPDQPFDLEITWSPAQISDKYISLVTHADSYEGGAHGRHDVATFNYDIAKRTMMTLADLFPDTPSSLNAVASSSKQQLVSSLTQMMGGAPPMDMINAGTKPTVDNYKNFTFTDYLITIYFPVYQVAPGAAGEQTVQISRAVIQ